MLRFFLAAKSLNAFWGHVVWEVCEIHLHVCVCCILSLYFIFSMCWCVYFETNDMLSPVSSLVVITVPSCQAVTASNVGNSHRLCKYMHALHTHTHTHTNTHTHAHRFIRYVHMKTVSQKRSSSGFVLPSSICTCIKHLLYRNPSIVSQNIAAALWSRVRKHQNSTLYLAFGFK